MKKLISLLLCVMMLASCLAFTATASSDESSYVMENPENSIAEGPLTTTRPGNNSFFSYYHGEVADVDVVVDENDENNRIFKLNGYIGATGIDSVLTFMVQNNMNDWKVRRFTSKVKFDTTSGRVDLYRLAPATSSGNWDATPTPNTFGVRLTNGGAYYYDAETGVYVSFIDEDTLSADTWYKVEAIMDLREASAKGGYMNAFVYDEEDNLIGTSGWQYVCTSTGTSYRAAKFQAAGYEEGEAVWLDEIAVAQVKNYPTYEMVCSHDADAEPVTYQYVSSDSSGSYRTLVAPFNGYGNGLVVGDKATGTSAPSTERAARMEMDVRFPEIKSDDQFDLFRLYGIYTGVSTYSDNTHIFAGTVLISAGSVKVRSWGNNGTSDTYTNTVTLDVGDSYQLSANKWYKFVWDIDYTDSSAPLGMLYIKDASSGEVLAKSAQPYAIQPMPLNSSSQNQNVMLLIASYKKNRVYNVDNTNLYKAVTRADLDTQNRTTVFEDSFETYAEDATYTACVKSRQNTTTAQTYWDSKAKIAVGMEAADTTVDLSTPLSTTEPISFTFTYSNPVPVANISTSTVELYADGAKMASGYTVTAGDPDANGCTDTFVVRITGLSWETDYTLRLKPEIADYNEALSGGIPAFTGYKDISFSTVSLEAEFTTAAELVDKDGNAITSATLNKGATVKGKLTFTDNGSNPYTCYAIVAVYKGAKLVDVKKSALITISANADLVEAETPVITVEEDGVTAKLFVWNNFETMKPIIASVVSVNR